MSRGRKGEKRPARIIQKTIVVIGAVILSLPPAIAAESLPGVAACWEIVPGVNSPPYTALKLNKCTGQSWFLSRTILRAAKQNVPGSWVYRWRPVVTDNEGEAGFSEQFNPLNPH
jgi:hypothetical protein